MNTKNFIYFSFIVGFSFLFICLVPTLLFSDDSISSVDGYFIGMLSVALWSYFVSNVKKWLEK